MHKRLAVAVAGGVCLMIMILGLQQKSLYSATSRVFVDPMDPSSISPQGGAGYDQLRYVSYMDQQMQTVTRDDILERALQALPAGTWRKQSESEQTATGRLAKALKVERLADGYEFSISLSSPDPKVAAGVVNAVANAYLQGGRRDELKQANGRVQMLAEERRRIEAEIAADQREQAALSQSLGVANPANDATNGFDTQLVNLRTQLANAREAHDVAEAKLAAVSGSAAEQQLGLAAAANESISTDQGLGSMNAAINSRRAVLQSAMAGMTQDNPVYKEDEAELADLRRLQDTETAKKRQQAEQRIQDGLRTDLERTGAVEAKLNAALTEETAKATGAEPKLLRAQELVSDVRRLDERYAAVDGIFRTLQLQTNGPGMAHVSTVAEPPALPESDRRLLFFLGALPVGMLFGTGAAVLARAVDQRVYVGADVQASVGLAPLSVLPDTDEVSPHVFDEHVLRLAAGLEGAYRRAGARTFVLTAASAGSDTSVLITAIAEKLRDLRLITAVVPAAQLLLPSSETAEYQAEATSPRQPKGDVAAQTMQGEGIASQKLERLKAAHDVVLIPGPALLHSGETEYAVRCADATILLTESRLTLKKELAATAELLARLQVRGVAVVLGGVRLSDADEVFRTTVQMAEGRGDATANRFHQEAVPDSSASIEPVIAGDAEAWERRAASEASERTATLGSLSEDGSDNAPTRAVLVGDRQSEPVLSFVGADDAVFASQSDTDPSVMLSSSAQTDQHVTGIDRNASAAIDEDTSLTAVAASKDPTPRILERYRTQSAAIPDSPDASADRMPYVAPADTPQLLEPSLHPPAPLLGPPHVEETGARKSTSFRMLHAIHPSRVREDQKPLRIRVAAADAENQYATHDQLSRPWALLSLYDQAGQDAASASTMSNSLGADAVALKRSREA